MLENINTIVNIIAVLFIVFLVFWGFVIVWSLKKIDKLSLKCSKCGVSSWQKYVKDDSGIK